MASATRDLQYAIKLRGITAHSQYQIILLIVTWSRTLYVCVCVIDLFGVIIRDSERMPGV